MSLRSLLGLKDGQITGLLNSNGWSTIKGAPDMFEMIPCNIYLPKNMENEGAWTKLLEIEWKKHQPSWQRLRQKFLRLQEQQSEDVQKEVDGLWTEFNKLLQKFLQKSTAKASFAMRFYGHTDRKDLTPSFEGSIWSLVNLMIRLPAIKFGC